ncbi:lysophospholipid acyltransferase family protein [uncultured Gelidibacter sp.]|uniref:lysophospholipid acyltransferase family protein n=1 Tax=uncultured Gelidibacter sp. TaxID=259318 RepID=UPI00262AB1DE|nr:lysophospholipid acyltransferase family protein [uncultured Gelidibacter sp.]
MQFLIYILVYPLIWLISILPFRLLYAFSDGLYIIIYKLVGYRKKVVQDNLRLVFPDKPESEIKTITEKFYHHFCDMMVEAIKSLTISEKSMNERLKFTNVELINEFGRQNRSIVLMCGHYGSWEWIFILQKHVIHKGYAVYSKLSNKYFDRLVKKIRAKYNSTLISTKETVPTLTRTKLNGELTINGFVSDQSPQLSRTFHWSEFMGIKVPIHTGAEMLAKRLDMSVVFFGVKRIKRGFYEVTFETLAANPHDFKDYEISDLFTKKVEAQIYEAPEYYLWTHRRWKHRNSVPEEFK